MAKEPFTLIPHSMFLELSRAFLKTDIEFNKTPMLQTYDDLPEEIVGNLKFAQFSAAVIFSVSYLESYCNWLFRDIFTEGEHSQHLRKFEKTSSILDSAKEYFCSKYETIEEYYKLKTDKKINELYYALGRERLSETKDKTFQNFYSTLKKLIDIRHNLIHLKYEYVISDSFLEFFNLTEKEFKVTVLTPSILVLRLWEEIPQVVIPNAAENEIIERMIFKFKTPNLLQRLLFQMKIQ